MHNDIANVNNNNDYDGGGNDSKVNRYAANELDVVLLTMLPVVKMQSHSADTSLLGIDKNNNIRLENKKQKVHKRTSRSGSSVRKNKR